MMTNQVARAATNLPAAPIERELEEYSPNFAAVLPPNIPVDHFKRMVVTAVNINPDLANADRRTLFNSCVKCASDGLLPDGREAALVIYRTKVKDVHGREQWVDAVQYMPMVAGIRKRLRNSGEVDSAIAEVVYRNDRFKYRLGDGAFIEHDPPALDEDRGDAIGAYAIVKLSSGEVIREVMSLKEIERVRAVSKAATLPAGPWVKWWGEMARKSVLRRAAKAAPQASTLEKLLMRDEDTDHLPTPEMLPIVPPRPRREDFAVVATESDDAANNPPSSSFVVIDGDGAEREYETAAALDEALRTILSDAAKRSRSHLEVMGENNVGALDQLRAAGLVDVADGLSAFYNGLFDNITDTPSPHDAAERAAQSLGGQAAARPSSVGEKIIAGLQDAVAFAKGDVSVATVHQPPLGGGDLLGDAIDQGWLRDAQTQHPGDPPDWPAYAQALIDMCGATNQATRGALQTAKLPHLMKLRTEDGDAYRRVMDALAGHP